MDSTATASPEEPPRQHIFALGVTELSERLGLLPEELLEGLSKADSSLPSGGTAEKNAVDSEAYWRPEDDAGPRFDVVVVVTPRALVELTPDVVDDHGQAVEPTVVLELILQRIMATRCASITLCCPGEAAPEIESLVDHVQDRWSQRPITFDVVYAGSNDRQESNVCVALRRSCTELQRRQPQPRSLVILESDRVFDVEAIHELVHQQKNAEVLTDDLTKAVILSDATTKISVGPDPYRSPSSAGLAVCSASAVQLLVEAEVKTTKIPSASAIEWVRWVLGDLHCQLVLASEEFNWSDVCHQVDGGVGLVRRFSRSNNVPGTRMGTDTEPKQPALTRLQDQLADEGIAAELYPIRTRMSYDPEGPRTTNTATERTPLFLPAPPRHGRLEATVLSEIDLCEDTQNHEGDAPELDQAFLIQTSSSSSCRRAGLAAAPELILALPEDRTKPTSADGARHLPHFRSRRRRSLLPSGVCDITLEAIVAPPKEQMRGTTTTARRVSVLLHIERQVPIVGYVILLTALCAVSSQGAVLDLLVGVPPLLKLFWRMTGASVAFAPFALWSVYHEGLPRLSRRRLGLFACCALSYTVFNSTFLIALSLTSIGHVYIFSNSHSLIMVLGKALLGHPLGALEVLGAALGFAGEVLTTTDTSSTSSTSSSTHATSSTTGDLVAFAGAFAGVSYLLCAKELRAIMSVWVFLFCLVTAVWLCLLPVLLLVVPSTRIGGDPWDPHTGLAGWTQHLGVEAYVVLAGSFCGTMGFITAMKYFDPLVVSVTMLTEPMVATAIGLGLGVDALPGWPTFLGGAGVVVGCGLVLLAGHRTSRAVDVSDQLVATSHTSAAEALGTVSGQQQTQQQRRRHSELPGPWTSSSASGMGRLKSPDGGAAPRDAFSSSYYYGSFP